MDTFLFPFFLALVVLEISGVVDNFHLVVTFVLPFFLGPHSLLSFAPDGSLLPHLSIITLFQVRLCRRPPQNAMLSSPLMLYSSLGQLHIPAPSSPNRSLVTLESLFLIQLVFLTLSDPHSQLPTEYFHSDGPQTLQIRPV